jgi:hypothetical protein
VVIPVTPKVPDAVILVAFVAANVLIPETESVPVMDVLSEFTTPNVVIPVTPKVPEAVILVAFVAANVLIPETESVPVMDVLPELSVLNVVVPVTPKVPEAVILVAFVAANVLIPETESVPVMDVLPELTTPSVVVPVTPKVPDAVILVAESPASEDAPETFKKLPIDISVPTNNFLAIAAPPAVVNVPPFVLEVASVVFDIPMPPASVKAPVELLVETVVFDETILFNVDIPETVKVVNVPNCVTCPREAFTDNVLPDFVRPVPAVI